MVRRIVLVGSLVLSQTITMALAFADHRVGNGGDAIVCRDAEGGITSAELLDFYEARLLRDVVPAFDAPAATPVEKALAAVSRIERFDPKRAKRYRAQVTSFLAESRIRDARLDDIPDSHHLAIPHGCAIEQLCVQRTPYFPEDKRYIIDELLWKHLSAEDQAGLILHEVLYREALERGQADSIAARYFTATIASGKLDGDYTLAQWKQLVKLVGFASTHWFDTETGWRWALVPAKGQTWAKARRSCSEIAGGYQLASIRELLFAYNKLSASTLAHDLLGPDAEPDPPAAPEPPTRQEPPASDSPAAAQSYSVLLWSGSRDTAGLPCATPGALPIKALQFFSSGEPGIVAGVCPEAVEPKTLCVARPD